MARRNIQRDLQQIDGYRKWLGNLLYRAELAVIKAERESGADSIRTVFDVLESVIEDERDAGDLLLEKFHDNQELLNPGRVKEQRRSLYDRLDALDWYYKFSDDGAAKASAEGRQIGLRDEAIRIGCKDLYDQFTRYKLAGGAKPARD